MNVQEIKRLPAVRRIILPLDTPDLEKMDALVDQLGQLIWGVKIGYIPALAHGASLIRRFVDMGVSVMADPKFFDIPNTVGGGAMVCRDAGASLCTMHASSGPKAMQKIADVCDSSNGGMMSLAVTVLTSMDTDECKAVYDAGPDVVVPRLTTLALEQGGAHGIVCSPADLPGLRATMPNFDDVLFVTPGVRLAGVSADDQARVATPGQAIRNGADLLVIGRPISNANDPLAATQAIVAEIDRAFDG